MFLEILQRGGLKEEKTQGKNETKKHCYPQPLSEDIANLNTAGAGDGTNAGAGIDAGASARHYAKEMILRKKCKDLEN